MTRTSAAPPSSPPEPKARSRRRLWIAVLSAFFALAIACALLRSTSSAPAERLPVAQAGDAGLRDAAPPDSGLYGPRFLGGSVQDDRGQPLGDARVQVRLAEANGDATREVRSDGEGQFRVEDLPAAALSIEVSCEGHETKEHTIRATESGHVTFVLARQGELLVALRDLPGNPVGGAEIVLTGPGLWPAQAARASATGEHVFKGLPAGQYRVRARRGARVAIHGAPAQVVPGERSAAELVLAEGASLSGLVIDQQTRKPLSGARIAIQDLTPGIDAMAVDSDAAGAFEAHGLWPGTARVEVQLAGYASHSRDIELAKTQRLELALVGAAAISGFVVDDDGAPLAGARLSIATQEGLPVELAEERDGRGPGTGELGVTSGPVPDIPPLTGSDFSLGTLAAESDAEGRFHVPQLAARELVLHAAKSGYVTERRVVSDLVPHQEKSGLRIVLRRAGRVLGRIVDKRGLALAGVYVAAHTSDGDVSALTDRDGEYVIRDVLGDVQIEAQPDGHTLLRCRARVAPRADARCDLQADTAVHTLSMRVVDEYGIGLEGALVAITGGMGQRASQVSRRDGTLVMRELPAPPYTIEVSLTGYLGVHDLEIKEAERELRIQLGRAATLAGFVFDALGRPVPSAFVSTLEGETSDETDERGTFTLSQVPPGAHALVAQHPSAGNGRSAEVRARPSERLDGIRIVLDGRYEPSSERDASEKRPAARVKEPRAELVLEQRGRVVVVTDLAPSGAAERAGLRIGDVIEAIDGERPLSAAHARGLLRDPPGRSALVRVVRSKRPTNVRYRRPAL